MTETATFRANSTFVIRFCRSCWNSGPYWHGRIEHVQSGKGLSFFDLADMLTFIGSFDIDLKGREWSETGSRMLAKN